MSRYRSSNPFDWSSEPARECILWNKARKSFACTTFAKQYIDGGKSLMLKRCATVSFLCDEIWELKFTANDVPDGACAKLLMALVGVGWCMMVSKCWNEVASCISIRHHKHVIVKASLQVFELDE